MNIYIFSRFKDSGGAAIAAKRLFETLQKRDYFDVFYVFYNDNKSLWNYCKKKIYFYLEYGLTRYLDGNVLRSLNMFSLIKVEDVVIESDAIVHLHWVNSGLISINQISKINNPLVITMHDAWLLCGTSHYFRDFDFQKKNKFQKYILKLLDDYTTYRKRKIENIKYIITPSNWLKDLVINDPHFSKFEVRVIPNSLNTRLYRPRNITKNNLNVLIHFESSNNLLKGGDLVLDFLNRIDLRNKTVHKLNFLLFGGSECVNVDFPNVINFGFVSDEDELIKIYQRCSLCLSFSRTENLPQYLTQAASCGLALVGFNVDGIPDVVIDNYNGFLVEPYDLDSYVRKFKMLLTDENRLKTFSENSRKLAMSKWDEIIVREQHEELYKSLSDISV